VQGPVGPAGVANVQTCNSFATNCTTLTLVTAPKIITGTRTGVTNVAATVTLPAGTFTSATSYKCTAQNVTNVSARVYVNQTGGTTFTLTAQTGTISVNFICVGN
jgi:hypothetical protein